MDADQLRELSTNALTGYWPPHLGVNTDQEKIEYLARQLEIAANDGIDTANEEIAALEGNLDDRANEIRDLELENAQLTQRVADLKKDKK